VEYSVTEVAKSCHGSTPAKTITGYGKSCEDNFATLLKMKTKMSSVSSGRSTAHKIPITVCL